MINSKNTYKYQFSTFYSKREKRITTAILYVGGENQTLIANDERGSFQLIC